jgi:hypothetical protein
MVEKKNAPRNEAEVGIAQIYQPHHSPETTIITCTRLLQVVVMCQTKPTVLKKT